MIHFGTGGWREIIGDKFTKENLEKIAQGIVSVMKSEKIAIGYDHRFLSDIAAKWISEVFAANGIKVLLSPNATPTPMTMFLVKEQNLEFGIHVTASHNPALYNGIKLIMQGGQDADTELTRSVEKMINSTDKIYSMNFSEAIQKKLVVYTDPRNKYIDSLLDYIDEKAIRKANLKILIDPMHGVSKTSLTIILSSLRCDINLINERQDTLFGGKLPAPSSANLVELKSKVKEESYDLGIATDGDADRVGIVDEAGNFIHPNILMALIYNYLLKYKNKKGPVVRNLATTHLLDRIADKYNEKVIETPVGFKYISEAMKKNNALIGGESSGGLTIRNHIPGKDGIFAALLLVEMVSVTKKNVSELVNELKDEFGFFYNEERDYSLSEKKKKNIINLLKNKEKYYSIFNSIKEIKTIDGLKILLNDDSWISVRFSGTEPLLRIFSESNSSKKATELIDTMELYLDI